MSGTPNEWEVKREENEEDQTGTSQQGLVVSASLESSDSTGQETQGNNENAEVGETAVQEGQHVNSLISEHIVESGARRSYEHFTESFISPHSGYLVPLRTGNWTTPTELSTTHEGESSQGTPSLSTIHHRQQRLIADHAKLVRNIIQVQRAVEAVQDELQFFEETMRELISRLNQTLGIDLSDKSDQD